ncbi:hypothetical protein [Azorhizophilus paspali]|uniref:Uncharacterized protein n=1 Tax=Azorhizophilus paspali TaxID=69963 RepID=A0ABV6SGZ7_AZOPA
MDALPTATAAAVLDRDGPQALIEALAARGFRMCGPVVRDAAIVYDEIFGVAYRPAGPTARRSASTAWSGVPTRRCSASPPRRRPGSASCRSWLSGQATGLQLLDVHGKR